MAKILAPAAIATCSLFLLTASPAHAQAAHEAYLSGMVGAPAKPSTSAHWIGAAGGFEAAVAPVVTTGGEVGFVTTERGGLLMTFSLVTRLSLVAGKGRRRVTPFIVGGYSYLEFLVGSAWSIGAGVDHHISARRSIRVELRDMIRFHGGSHFWSARVSIVFR